MSVRASAGLPSTCSGTMYCGVPRMAPWPVMGVVRVCAASPRGGHRLGLGQPEIQQLQPRLGDQDVARLQVTVHDPLAMGGVQRIGNLQRQPQGFFERQRPLERLALFDPGACRTLSTLHPFRPRQCERGFHRGLAEMSWQQTGFSPMAEKVRKNAGFRAKTQRLQRTQT
jgi:hypothetical protein